MLAGAAGGMGWMRVTAAMGPTVVGIVVSADGPEGHGLTLVVAASGPGCYRSALVVSAIVGAWCWGWLFCQVLHSKGLGDALLDHGSHVRGEWVDGWVGDSAGE